MSDAKFGSWSVAESPISIEYSLVVLEEIRHEVAEGFQRLSRGGIEVGGVLYGTREGRSIRILAMRPIACEHARGPAFLLSDKDRIALNQQLLTDGQDPHLQGLISVGWFLSHTRSEIMLSDSDMEIYSLFFTAPWQVTLVIRPGRGGMRAGFFVREADGSVGTESSYLEFNFPDRLAGVLDRMADRPPRERGPMGGRRPSGSQRAELAAVPSPVSREVQARASQADAFNVARTNEAVPQFLTTAPPRRKWPWLVVWAMLVIAATIFGLRYWMPTGRVEPMSLAVVEREGQLQLEWNHSAKPISSAVRGSLQIVDGANARIFPLTPAMLAAGHFTYARKTGDVEIRMTVENAEGVRVQEASRFLGQPPENASANADELTQLRQRRDQDVAEVARLRQANSAQAAKIQQLERTLQILKTRLGIEK